MGIIHRDLKPVLIDNYILIVKHRNRRIRLPEINRFQPRLHANRQPITTWRWNKLLRLTRLHRTISNKVITKSSIKRHMVIRYYSVWDNDWSDTIYSYVSTISVPKYIKWWDIMAINRFIIRHDFTISKIIHTIFTLTNPIQ